jgi:hypothetical protein
MSWLNDLLWRWFGWRIVIVSKKKLGASQNSVAPKDKPIESRYSGICGIKKCGIQVPHSHVIDLCKRISEKK